MAGTQPNEMDEKRRFGMRQGRSNKENQGSGEYINEINKLKAIYQRAVNHQSLK
jgi:hypothetical protein